MTEMSPAEAVFFAALERAPADRAAYLDDACADNPALRARVEKLLAAHPKAEGFLEPPGERMAPASGGRQPPDTIDHQGADAPRSPDAATGPLAAGLPTTAAHVPEPDAGVVIAGRYKLLQQIGEGGMGTVWMADQTEPVKRRVAVKLIRAERGHSRTILSRFEAERQAIALMDHPHIAKLLDAGTTAGGQPFFVMELVKGVPLTDYCDQHRLTVPDRLRLFAQVCGAVQHAHQKGVIHRDLKPSNILVESHDDRPVPKVIDFGLAKAASGLQLSDHTLFTAFGSVMGTPLYMAPEQAKFNAVDIDTRADVYALGVILYELLTGSTPIARDMLKKAALDEMLRLVREQEPPSPSSRLSSGEGRPTVAANRQTEPAKLGRFVKGELDWIVLKALSKERDRRYESATGFARDVERFLNHEPVAAGPPGAGYRVRKFVQRNKVQVTAAGLVLLALVGGVIGTTLGLVEARRQRDAADTARQAEAEQRATAESATAAEAAQRRAAEAAADRERAALAAEKAASEQAKKRLAQVEKGVDLLGSIFADLDPRAEQKDGGSLRLILAARLDQAARQLDGEAVSDPLTIARLQNTLGLSLLGLGQHDQAQVLFEKAATVMVNALGSDHLDTLAAQNNLGLAHRSAGRNELAIPLYEQTLKTTEAKHGADHPSTLLTRRNLASAYRAVGRLDEAVQLIERTLATQEAHGDDLPGIIITRNNLGWTYLVAGRAADAITLFERALRESEGLHGPDHPHSLTFRHNLAVAHQATGRHDLAVPLLERTAAARATKLGVDHSDTIVTRGNLVEAYLATGRSGDALPLVELNVRAQRKQLGAGTSAFSGLLARVSTELLGAGQFGATEPYLRECLAIREKAQPDAWTTFNTRSQLGGSLLGQGKHAEAEPLLLAGYDGMKARAKAIPTQGRDRLPEAADRLVELYVAVGKPAEAAKWRAERATYPFVAPPPRPAK